MKTCTQTYIEWFRNSTEIQLINQNSTECTSYTKSNPYLLCFLQNKETKQKYLLFPHFIFSIPPSRVLELCPLYQLCIQLPKLLREAHFNRLSIILDVVEDVGKKIRTPCPSGPI